MEKNVTIQCRQEDKEIITSLLPAVCADYTVHTGLPLDPVVDKAALSVGSCGGVVVSCLEGKIRVDNTLVARLEIISEAMLPDIKEQLFGASPNRRFYN